VKGPYVAVGRLGEVTASGAIYLGHCAVCGRTLAARSPDRRIMIAVLERHLVDKHGLDPCGQAAGWAEVPS